MTKLSTKGYSFVCRNSESYLSLNLLFCNLRRAPKNKTICRYCLSWSPKTYWLSSCLRTDSSPVFRTMLLFKGSKMAHSRRGPKWRSVLDRTSSRWIALWSRDCRKSMISSSVRLWEKFAQNWCLVSPIPQDGTNLMKQAGDRIAIATQTCRANQLTMSISFGKITLSNVLQFGLLCGSSFVKLCYFRYWINSLDSQLKIR